MLNWKYHISFKYHYSYRQQASSGSIDSFETQAVVSNDGQMSSTYHFLITSTVALFPNTYQ